MEQSIFFKKEVDLDKRRPVMIAEEEEKLKLLHLSEISLILDSYDDIFSDFDPRPYSQRALSGDFLDELRKASRDKDSKIELKFMIPISKINKRHEGIIKGRLKEHFHKHYNLLKKEITDTTIKRGAVFIVMGLIFMFLATLIMFKYTKPNMLLSFFIVLLEPAGWFCFWEGLWLVIFESKERKPELDFYEKMTKSDISFIAY